MKKLFAVLFVTMMATCTLFADTDVAIEPVSDSDFAVTTSDGVSLCLLEDIDSALAKFDLTFDGIEENPTNPKLDFFSYSNENIELGRYRAWNGIYSIVLKNNETHLNRNVRIGDSVEAIYANYNDTVLKTNGRLYLSYASNNEESPYYFPVYLFFEIEDGVIEQIVLEATYD